MLVFLALARAADAVPDVVVDGQMYRPPIDAAKTLWADDTSLAPGVRAGVVVGWVHEPVVWVWEDTGERVPLVADAVGLNLLAAYTFSRLRVGLDVPVYPFASGNAGSGGGVGDVALDVKGVVLPRDMGPVGLAIAFRADLPTASTTVPLAADGFAYELSLIADRKFGPVMLAANLGTRGLPAVDAESVEVGDQLAWRFGAGFSPRNRWGVSADLAGYATWSDLDNAAGAPAEVMLGGWVGVSNHVRVSLGAGHGLTSGIGASNGRVVAGFAWLSGPPKAKAAPVASPAPPPVVAAAPPPPVVVVAPLPPVVVVAPLPPVVVVAPLPPVVVAPPAPIVSAANPVAASAARLFLFSPVSFDGAVLTAAGAAQLSAVVGFLESHPEIESIRIEGHTSGAGDASDELGLAGQRAGVVLEFLSEAGLSSERFYAAGYGGMRPLVPGTEPGARAVNERIEFVVTQWTEGREPK
ncbi:MAG: OmpA family protein [Myxococcales bacterium]|nr:OmpA family protein [Myxococcales bacterium]